MRLLDTTTVQFVESDLAKVGKKYAILSHRWRSGREVSYEQYVKELEISEHPLQNARESYLLEDRSGMVKIIDFCTKAKQDGYGLAWIDTCCIDKRSSAELQEAINSMYSWYAESARCYVYLSDVEDAKGVNWKQSDWWSRGWTLQELIAPQKLTFYDKFWRRIGDRADEKMAREIALTANLPREVLKSGGREKLYEYPVGMILSWASHRTTTRVEDEAYSLLGLLEVNMPMLYGEGRKAFRRLQQIHFEQTGDETIFAYEGDPTEQMPSVFATSATQFKTAKITSNAGNVGIMRPWRNKPPEITCWGLNIVSSAIKMTLHWSGTSKRGHYNGLTSKIKKSVKNSKSIRATKEVEIHEIDTDKMVDGHSLEEPHVLYIIRLACAWFNKGETKAVQAKAPCYMVVFRTERRRRGCYDCVREPFVNFLSLEAIEQELKQEYADAKDPPYIQKTLIEESSFYVKVHT